MKNFCIAAAAALTLALCSSCNLNVDQIYINAEYLFVTCEGGSFEAPLYATGAWTATVICDENMKMSVSPESGNGSGTITIKLEPLESDESSYQGFIQLECGKAKTSFPVYQLTEEDWKTMEEQNGNSPVAN